jgi:hypothetical protein
MDSFPFSRLALLSGELAFDVVNSLSGALKGLKLEQSSLIAFAICANEIFFLSALSVAAKSPLQFLSCAMFNNIRELFLTTKAFYLYNLRSIIVYGTTNIVQYHCSNRDH